MGDIDCIKKLARLIAHENTGCHQRLAQQFGISQKTITNWVKALEELYFVKICYCRTTQTYKVIKGELPPPYLK